MHAYSNLWYLLSGVDTEFHVRVVGIAMGQSMPANHNTVAHFHMLHCIAKKSPIFKKGMQNDGIWPLEIVIRKIIAKREINFILIALSLMVQATMEFAPYTVQVHRAAKKT